MRFLHFTLVACPLFYLPYRIFLFFSSVSNSLFNQFGNLPCLFSFLHTGIDHSRVLCEGCPQKWADCFWTPFSGHQHPIASWLSVHLQSQSSVLKSLVSLLQMWNLYCLPVPWAKALIDYYTSGQFFFGFKEQRTFQTVVSNQKLSLEICWIWHVHQVT